MPNRFAPELVVFDGSRPRVRPHLREPASQAVRVTAGRELGVEASAVEKVDELVLCVAREQLGADQALEGLLYESFVALLEAGSLVGPQAAELVA
jgi:hypothetical protein